jgi:hypothetical protein
VKLDDAAGAWSSPPCVPPGGLRRDELHFYDLAGPGRAEGPVHRLTRDIEDVESATLSRDGERIAVGCGPDVCIRRWDAEAVESQLPAGARRRELGARAFRPDLGLLVAAQRQRMQIIAWELAAPRADSGRWRALRAGARLSRPDCSRPHGFRDGSALARRPARRVDPRRRHRVAVESPARC